MLGGADAYEDGFRSNSSSAKWGIRIGGGTEQVQRNILGNVSWACPPSR